MTRVAGPACRWISARRSHRDNFALRDGDRFNDGVFRIDSQDLAVDQDHVGSLRRAIIAKPRNTASCA